MRTTLPLIAALCLLPATAAAKPGLSMHLAGAGGYFTTDHPQGNNSALMLGRLGADYGIGERVELGLALGLGLTNGRGVGYLEPHVKVHLLTTTRLRPYLKAGFFYSYGEDALGRALFSGMPGEVEDPQSDFGSHTSEGLGLVLGAGLDYCLSESWFAMLELSDQLASAGAEGFNSSLQLALGIGVTF